MEGDQHYNGMTRVGSWRSLQWICCNFCKAHRFRGQTSKCLCINRCDQVKCQLWVMALHQGRLCCETWKLSGNVLDGTGQVGALTCPISCYTWWWTVSFEGTGQLQGREKDEHQQETGFSGSMLHRLPVTHPPPITVGSVLLWRILLKKVWQEVTGVRKNSKVSETRD